MNNDRWLPALPTWPGKLKLLIKEGSPGTAKSQTMIKKPMKTVPYGL